MKRYYLCFNSPIQSDDTTRRSDHLTNATTTPSVQSEMSSRLSILLSSPPLPSSPRSSHGIFQLKVRVLCLLSSLERALKAARLALLCRRRHTDGSGPTFTCSRSLAHALSARTHALALLFCSFFLASPLAPFLRWCGALATAFHLSTLPSQAT